MKKQPVDDESMIADAVKARRSNNIIVQRSAAGDLVARDMRDLVAEVLRDPQFKEAVNADIVTLFDNYLTNRVPMLLAQLLKESGFMNGSKPFMPNDLILAFKTHAADNLDCADEKQTALRTIRTAFRDYVRSYVRTILENISV